MRAQSVSPGVRARPWQAAIAAWRAYGPTAPPSPSARASAARPRRMRSWSQRAVLVEEQHGLSRGADPGAQARSLDLHEGDQAVDLRLLRSELREDAAEAERVLAERGPRPVLTRGRRVALV